MIQLVEAFGGCCSSCGFDVSHTAMDFHHVDPTSKRFTLALDRFTRSWGKIVPEAMKCILVCANCHTEIEAGVRECPPQPDYNAVLALAQADT